MSYRLIVASRVRARETEHAEYLTRAGAADAVVNRWFDDLDATLDGLKLNPRGRPLCLDAAAADRELREAYVGRGRTHRYIFEVRGTDVFVTLLWPTALGDFTAGDL